jgi:hypothetical protein
MKWMVFSPSLWFEVHAWHAFDVFDMLSKRRATLQSLLLYDFEGASIIYQSSNHCQLP